MEAGDEESNKMNSSSCYSSPLLRSLLVHQEKRTSALQWEGRHQILFPKSNEGWLKTICMIRGRGLDHVVGPWSVCVGHALLYAILNHEVDQLHSATQTLGSWEVVFTFVLNSTLAFLLVFRLNRAAERYWISRKYWGDIVANTRTMVSGLIVHASPQEEGFDDRDGAIRWLGVFALATMEFLRRGGSGGGATRRDYPTSCFAGLLTPPQVSALQEKHHPPLYAADRVRFYMKRLFLRAGSSADVIMANTIRMDRLEEQLNNLVWRCGGLERIQATPLPMVYVSHLRTFLFINLLLFPWVFGHTWGVWSTVPIVALSGFAWIGIDAASVEVESPFQQERVNALNMNTYVLGLMNTIQDQLLQSADESPLQEL